MCYLHSTCTEQGQTKPSPENQATCGATRLSKSDKSLGMWLLVVVVGSQLLPGSRFSLVPKATLEFKREGWTRAR